MAEAGGSGGQVSLSHTGSLRPTWAVEDPACKIGRMLKERKDISREGKEKREREYVVLWLCVHDPLPQISNRQTGRQMAGTYLSYVFIHVHLIYII